MSDSESSSLQSNFSLDYRPNRHLGGSRKWLHMTERERGEHSGLIRARNEDLSIHLYNSHKLRQRSQEFEDNPLNARINIEFPEIPSNQRTFNPPNGWTAWPLAPDDVPRSANDLFKFHSFDECTLEREIRLPSQELEEIIHGITLKLARRKFESRQHEDDKDLITDELVSGILPGDDDLNIETEGNPSAASPESTTDQFIRSRGAHLEPVFCIDDERSCKVLRPSIRHILTKIDKVLTGLHETRKICYSYSYLDKNLDDKNPSANPQVDQSGETNQKLTIPDDTTRAPMHTSVPDNLPTLKKPRRGRPCKIYERLDGETEQEFLVRIARKKKKAIPVSLRPNKQENPTMVKKKLPARSFKTSSMDRFLHRQRKLGLRDWSEVISIAALVGLPKDVILKTTQRCVNLFDESILIKTLNETHYKNKILDSKECFRPSQNSCYPLSNTAPLITNPESNTFLADVQNHNTLSNILLPKRNLMTKQIYFCPIIHCPRKLLGFRDQSGLLRHIDQGHGIKPEFTKDQIFPSPEDLHGAIHVDGFLRCVGLPNLGSKKVKETNHNLEIRPPQLGCMKGIPPIQDPYTPFDSANDWTSPVVP